MTVSSQIFTEITAILTDTNKLPDYKDAVDIVVESPFIKVLVPLLVTHLSPLVALNPKVINLRSLHYFNFTYNVNFIIAICHPDVIICCPECVPSVEADGTSIAAGVHSQQTSYCEYSRFDAGDG